MRAPLLTLLCPLLLFSGSNVNAGTDTDDYICTIERVSQATGDFGSTYELLNKVFVGRQFTVDRTSGVTIGTLKNSLNSKPMIIDPGSSENSFKVVSAITASQNFPGTFVTALNVMGFVDGEKKPFNYMINDEVYFGTCVSF
jgi:hypothetical protein